MFLMIAPLDFSICCANAGSGSHTLGLPAIEQLWILSALAISSQLHYRGTTKFLTRFWGRDGSSV